MESGELIDARGLTRLQDASYERGPRGFIGSWPRESAMDASELRAFLEAHHYCVLATTSARGHAQARPVAFTVFGTSFWFATVAGSRLRNLQRTPWASAVVAEGERGSHRAVIVEGPARLTEQPSEALAAAWEARHGSRAEWAAAWFEVEPTRLFSYQASPADEEVVPVLRVADAARAVEWYERLGFRKEWEHQFEPGFPWFVSIARGELRLYLSEHTGDAPPSSLVHLYVGDIEAVSAEFGVPVDEEGLAGRECDLEDPDGNRLRVATRRY